MCRRKYWGDREGEWAWKQGVGGGRRGVEGGGGRRGGVSPPLSLPYLHLAMQATEYIEVQCRKGDLCSAVSVHLHVPCI